MEVPATYASRGRKILICGLGPTVMAVVVACSSGSDGPADARASTSPSTTQGPVTTAVATTTVAPTARATATPGPTYHSVSASELTARDEGKPLLPVAREADIVSLKFPASSPRGQYAGLVLAAGTRIVSPISGTVSALKDFTTGSFGAYRYVQITPATGLVEELILAPSTTLASDIAVGTKVTRGTTAIGVYEEGRLGGSWNDYSMLLSVFPTELAAPDSWATGLPAILRTQP